MITAHTRCGAPATFREVLAPVPGSIFIVLPTSYSVLCPDWSALPDTVPLVLKEQGNSALCASRDKT